MKGGREIRDNNFTIVELLVVAVIISVLAAILLPSLSLARNRAKAAQCMGNLKQIALALNSYSGDFDGYFVPYKDSGITHSSGSGYYWSGKFSAGKYDLRDNLFFGSYVANCAAIFVCPNVLGRGVDVRAATETGYGYNGCWLGGYTEVDGSAFRPKTSRVKNPSNTVSFADTAYINATMGGAIYTMMLWPRIRPDGSSGFNGIHFRHNRSANVAWIDGHVSPEKAVETVCYFNDGEIGDFSNTNAPYSIYE